MTTPEKLTQALRFLVYRDLMNSEVHGSPVRWSPVTTGLAESIRDLHSNFFDEASEPHEVEEVLAFNFKISGSVSP